MATKEIVTNKNQEDDEVQKCMGPMGKYQFLIVLLLFPCKITTAFHPLGIVFLAPPVKYICRDASENGTYGLQNVCPCTDPDYDRTLFQDTIVMSWNLICDREWLVSINQTILMLGMLMGSLIFGTMSDRFGRRIIIAPVILEMVAGISASFVKSYWVFLTLRFFMGCSVGGTMIISFVLLVEFSGKRYRELVACLVQIPFNLGYLLLPLIGYYIRTWQWFQYTISIVPVLMLVTFWFLPESPRWLLAKEKTDEAIAVLKRAAYVNNRPTDRIEEVVKNYQANKPKTTSKNGTIVDLYRMKNMRKNIICMSINWVVCSLGFFGLSQYIGTLDGNIFINVAISAGLNLCGTFTAYIFIRLLKRKTALCSLHIITSICMFVISVIPKEGAIFKVVLACVGNVGMFVVFVVVYLYTCELFPTVIRNAAVGTASMMARIGSMTAPFVVSLNATASWLPPVIFGSTPIMASMLCLFLPETKGCDLPNSLAEGENFGKNQKS